MKQKKSQLRQQKSRPEAKVKTDAKIIKSRRRASAKDRIANRLATLQAALSPTQGKICDSPLVTSPWTTMDNSKEDESIVSSKAVLKNIEHMLDREGMYPAYLEAVKASGGDSCTWENKLKIAGYIYYGGVPGRDGRSPLVKKPMSLIKDSEKVDEIREDVTKAWGDIKIRPERRPLVTEETYKKWRDRIYPAPHQTANDPKSFSELSLDDRISWSHIYMSKYHEMKAEAKPLDTCVLTSMEFTCKKVNIPVFIGEDRNIQFIEFIAEEYTGLTPMTGLMDVIRGIEESQPAEYVKHDAKCEVIDFSKALKLLKSTLKSMKLMDLYNDYVAIVRGSEGGGDDGKYMEIANYLISCGSPKGVSFKVEDIPQCLLDAMDSLRHASFKDKLDSLKRVDTEGFLPRSWGKTTVKSHKIAKSKESNCGFGSFSKMAAPRPKVDQMIDVKVDGKYVGVAYSSLFCTYNDRQMTYHKEIEAKGMSILEAQGFDGKTIVKTIIVPDKSINFVGCKKKSKIIVAKRRK